MKKKNDSLGKLIESYKEDLETIIPEAMSILENQGYTCRSNSKMTEVIVEKEKKEEIQSVLESSLDLPSMVLGFILTIRVKNERVFIRQRVK